MSFKVGTNGVNYEFLSSMLGTSEADVQAEEEHVAANEEFVHDVADIQYRPGEGSVLLPGIAKNLDAMLRMRTLNALLPKEVDVMPKELETTLNEGPQQLGGTLSEQVLDEVLNFGKMNIIPTDVPAGLPRLPSPLFVQGAGDANSVDMNDVNQGRTGDCWLMGPLAEYASKDPEAIKRMIKDNGDGTYTVTFKQRVYVPGVGEIVVDRPITVTADFYPDLYLPYLGRKTPHGTPGDVNSQGKGEIWPLIIEKAYTEYTGKYTNLVNGGNPAEFMEALTGQKAKSYNGTRLPQQGGIQFEDLKNEFDAGKNVVFCTDGKVEGPYGLKKNHCYAVKRVYIDENGRKMIELYNPWGPGQSQPDAIPYDEASFYFSSIIMN